MTHRLSSLYRQMSCLRGEYRAKGRNVRERMSGLIEKLSAQILFYTKGMDSVYRLRRFIALIIVLIAIAIPLSQADYQTAPVQQPPQAGKQAKSTLAKLETLPVKGRAPKTGYERAQFGDGWSEKDGCSTRDIILARDMTDLRVNGECKVMSGTLHDPYTGKTISFIRGPSTSSDVQIDHVVALGDAWQTGAQQLSYERRVELANDPLELLAVDGPANQQKSDGDAATWLPSYKPFRCQYVTRQIDIKAKYSLWVKPAEKQAMIQILSHC